MPVRARLLLPSLHMVNHQEAYKINWPNATQNVEYRSHCSLQHALLMGPSCPLTRVEERAESLASPFFEYAICRRLASATWTGKVCTWNILLPNSKLATNILPLMGYERTRRVNLLHFHPVSRVLMAASQPKAKGGREINGLSDFPLRLFQSIAIDGAFPMTALIISVPGRHSFQNALQSLVVFRLANSLWIYFQSCDLVCCP